MPLANRPLRRPGSAPRALAVGGGIPGGALVCALVGTLAGGVAAAATLPLAAPAPVERELLLMGTRLLLAVSAGDRASSVEASEQAVAALAATEARLSTWRDDSELARLNTAAEPVTLSPELADELATALACQAATAGAFDPTVGSLVELWDLRGVGRVPTAEQIAAARRAGGAGGLVIEGRQARRLAPGLRLEEGGFGKGAGLDRALAALRRRGDVQAAWLDLGGQAAYLGTAPWRVTVAHPDERERPVAALTLAAGSLSTSGNGERRRHVAGRRVGHLLDPRRGEPASDFGSLTVWVPASDPALPAGLLADCLSTGLYVLGPERALAWAAAQPGVEVLVLERSAGQRLRARASAGFAGRLVALDPDLIVELEAPAAERRAGNEDGAAGPLVNARQARCSLTTHALALARRSGSSEESVCRMVASAE